MTDADMSQDPEFFDDLPDEDRRRRLRDAIARSPDVVKARQWLEGERPQQLREMTRQIAASYAEVENSSPAQDVLGPWLIDSLATDDPLRRIWPDPSLTAREIMFRATHLYRTLGLLVAEAGSDLASSLHVVGRSLLEALSLIDWLLESLRAGDDPSATRAVARRTCLLALARVAELGFESEDFEMPDLPELNGLLADGRDRAAQLFGDQAVSLSRRNPSNWVIDGDGFPRKSDLVNSVGETIFSRGVRASSHYRTPSLAVHASLAAPLGRLVPIDGPDNVYKMYCIDVDSVEQWLWYYTVWYRYGVGLMAGAHHWPLERVGRCDRDAQTLLGRAVIS